MFATKPSSRINAHSFLTWNNSLHFPVVHRQIIWLNIFVNEGYVVWSETNAQGEITLIRNLFKNTIISELFLALSQLIQTYFWQRSIHCLKALSNSFLAMVLMTPEQVVLQMSWDNESPSSSDLSLRNRKKVCWRIYRWIGWVANRLGTAGLRRKPGPGYCPCTEHSPGMTIRTFSA